jgi:Ima1 N-terminal domain
MAVLDAAEASLRAGADALSLPAELLSSDAIFVLVPLGIILLILSIVLLYHCVSMCRYWWASKWSHQYLVSSCWFCAASDKLARSDPNMGWYCTTCGQYNGFTQEGDYDMQLPQFRDASMNQRAEVLQSKYLQYDDHDHDRDSASILCDACEDAVQASIVNREHTAGDDHDNAAEDTPLCDECQVNVQKHLDALHTKLGISTVPNLYRNAPTWIVPLRVLSLVLVVMAVGAIWWKLTRICHAHHDCTTGIGDESCTLVGDTTLCSYAHGITLPLPSTVYLDSTYIFAEIFTRYELTVFTAQWLLLVVIVSYLRHGIWWSACLAWLEFVVFNAVLLARFVPCRWSGYPDAACSLWIGNINNTSNTTDVSVTWAIRAQIIGSLCAMFLQLIHTTVSLATVPFHKEPIRYRYESPPSTPVFGTAVLTPKPKSTPHPLRQGQVWTPLEAGIIDDPEEQPPALDIGQSWTKFSMHSMQPFGEHDHNEVVNNEYELNGSDNGPRRDGDGDGDGDGSDDDGDDDGDTLPNDIFRRPSQFSHLCISGDPSGSNSSSLAVNSAAYPFLASPRSPRRLSWSPSQRRPAQRAVSPASLIGSRDDAALEMHTPQFGSSRIRRVGHSQSQLMARMLHESSSDDEHDSDVGTHQEDSHNLRHKVHASSATSNHSTRVSNSGPEEGLTPKPGTITPIALVLAAFAVWLIYPDSIAVNMMYVVSLLHVVYHQLSHWNCHTSVVILLHVLALTFLWIDQWVEIDIPVSAMVEHMRVFCIEVLQTIVVLAHERWIEFTLLVGMCSWAWIRMD